MGEKPESRLVRFYDEKYSNQRISTNTIPLKHFPRNRYDAGVKWGGLKN